MSRRLLAVLVLLSALAALTGCGGGDDVTGKSASEVLRSTFGPNRAITSGRLDASLRVTGLQASQQPLTFDLRGPFAGSGNGGQPRFDLDVSLTARGVGLTGGATSTGTAGFLTLGKQSYEVDAKTYAAFREAYADEGATDPKDTTTLGRLGVDPLRWLKDPKKEGEEQVAGEKTVHVSSGVDVPALLTDVSSILGRANAAGASQATGQDVQLTAAERQTIQAAVTSATLDVWTGADDSKLRRVAVHVAYDVPAARRDAAGGLTEGTFDLGLTLAELNVKQSISAPKDPRPLSELSSALSQLSGSASGSGG